MRARLTLLAVLALALSCRREHAVPDAISGTGGDAALPGEEGGHPATGGKGGASSTMSACVAQERFALKLLDEQWHDVPTGFSAPVRVVSVARCDDACPSGVIPDPSSALRISLVGIADLDTDAGAAAARWTLLLQAPLLPDGTLQVGQSYDLIANVDNTVLGDTRFSLAVGLTQRGAPQLIFARVRERNLSLTLPTLEPWGIGLERAAVSCENLAQNMRQYAVRVTRGQDSVVVPRGGSGQLGELTVVPVRCDTVVNTSTDGFNNFELAIFRL